MDSIKISKIGFNPSKYPDVSVVKFDLENLTLIVGPNNSGKSSVLSNIQQFSYGE
ncbi:MAG: AAA family ATPase, partial [Thaumarchaeota archaeon]|nr:AAA family ATPase [Nitrososphaerota archaeon]